MIPQRITVEGFLCYRTAQTIDLSGAALWMLAGPNGSGKSTTFDAITFALFGHHRGGQKNARELINKASDRLLVEFDFLHADQLYQARRTLKRKGSPAGTWQVRRWRGVSLPSPLGGEESGVRGETNEPGWEEVADTSTEVGFDRWVRHQLGLTYETFTSSVLLLQGKADNLLAAVPAKRFEVLAGVVGLDRYQKLHERVETRRKELLQAGKTLLQQLNGVRVIDDAELAEADRALADGEADRQSAQAEVERLQVLEFQAGRWAELQTTLASVRHEWEAARELLARADVVERDWGRLTELRQNLPHLVDCLEQRERLEDTERDIARLSAQGEALTARLQEADYALEQVRQKLFVLDRAEAAETNQRLQRIEERQTLALALPLLRQFHQARRSLQEADRRARTAEESARAAGVRLSRREADRTPVADHWQVAVEARRAADHEVTRTGTLRAEAQKRADRFFSAVGEKLCRYCGQPLTPGHVDTERTKLARELAAAEEQHRRATETQANAVQEEAERRAQAEDAERLCTEARREVDEWSKRRQDAERDAVRHAEECTRAYADLAETYRVRIGPTVPADWRSTEFPTADDLGALAESFRDLARAVEQLHRQGEARRQEIRQAGEERERLVRERESIRQLLADTDRELDRERVRRETCHEFLARIRDALAPGWRHHLQQAGLRAAMPHWEAERTALEEQKTAEQVDQLQRARASHDSLDRHRQDLEREQDLFPEGARCEPGQIGRLLTAARDRQADHERTLRAAQECKATLFLLRTQREQLQGQLLATERQHKLYQKLAQLLGRDRLQLHLVRQAERGIVEYANAVLGRISGGQLYLRLCGSEKGEDPSDKALQLEAINREAGQEPIRVEFLSGSQRFRVAVSLALGIGQYASREHRPVEAVIIDEGFGCLDKTNRLVMIQELQNLRGQLRRILVVSHQEEFATAFADGYHFELVNGTTEVTRFQR